MFYRNLYPVLDTAVCEKNGVDVVGFARILCENGSKRFQLRAKGMNFSQYRTLAEQIFSETSASLIANDHLEIAANPDSGSDRLFDGLHIGQEDFESGMQRFSGELTALLARYRSSGKITGFSTHSVSQVKQALSYDCFSYIATGPWFPTDSKPTGNDPVLSDLEKKQMLDALIGANMPAVFIGGFTPDRVRELRSLLQKYGFAGSPGASMRPVALYIAAIGSLMNQNGIKKMQSAVSELLDLNPQSL